MTRKRKQPIRTPRVKALIAKVARLERENEKLERLLQKERWRHSVTIERMMILEDRFESL